MDFFNTHACYEQLRIVSFQEQNGQGSFALFLNQTGPCREPTPENGDRSEIDRTSDQLSNRSCLGHVLGRPALTRKACVPGHPVPHIRTPRKRETHTSFSI